MFDIITKNTLFRFFQSLNKRKRINRKKRQNYNALKIIEQAALQRRKVKIKYKKTSGEVVEKIIRPYELKKHRHSGTRMLYATDDNHGAHQIHSFRASRILSATPLRSKFKPVWEIKFPSDEI